MPENNNEYNAWNRFRNNDYENFKTNCLHNTRDYGVLRFEDRDVNKKLKRNSEFIEIYQKDATRTPCVVIEADTKISAVKDNDVYETTTVHYLYRDPNFLKKFGSLEVLAVFATIL